MAVKAYLQVTMVIPEKNRAAAAKVYTDYREPFLKTIPGAETKDLFKFFMALIALNMPRHTSPVKCLPSMFSQV